MTKRHTQLQLAARHTRAFAREAGRLNFLAVETSRAQHERHRFALAAAYRVSNGSSR